jgi:poly-gamma-glutamate capsule biosynthesis protein CapA/YwtB (metallophosphatase superfamily)
MFIGLFSCGAALAQPADLNARLLACRAIGEVTARAACYDRLVDALRPPVPAVSAPLSPAIASPPPVPPPAAAAPASPVLSQPAARFGAESLPREKREPGVPPPPDEIIAKAVSVRADANDYVIVTLDNGQTWRQTDGQTLRVLPGAEVKIRSGLIGSYLMSLVGSNRSVRAKRIN